MGPIVRRRNLSPGCHHVHMSSLADDCFSARPGKTIAGLPKTWSTHHKRLDPPPNTTLLSYWSQDNVELGLNLSHGPRLYAGPSRAHKHVPQHKKFSKVKSMFIDFKLATTKFSPIGGLAQPVFLVQLGFFGSAQPFFWLSLFFWFRLFFCSSQPFFWFNLVFWFNRFFGSAWFVLVQLGPPCPAETRSPCKKNKHKQRQFQKH